MRTTVILLTIFTTAFTFSANSAIAKDKVYRWVDENGVVHFENQAPSQTEAEQISIPSDHRSDNQTASESPYEDSAQEPESQVSYAQQQRDERARERKEAAEKEQLTAATCEQSRKVIAQLEPATRVLVEQDDGTIIRMDDNDRLERLREEKNNIAENCQK